MSDRTELELYKELSIAAANLLIAIDENKDNNIIFFSKIIDDCNKTGMAMKNLLDYQNNSELTND